MGDESRRRRVGPCISSQEVLLRCARQGASSPTCVCVETALVALRHDIERSHPLRLYSRGHMRILVGSLVSITPSAPSAELLHHPVSWASGGIGSLRRMRSVVGSPPRSLDSQPFSARCLGHGGAQLGRWPPPQQRRSPRGGSGTRASGARGGCQGASEVPSAPSRGRPDPQASSRPAYTRGVGGRAAGAGEAAASLQPTDDPRWLPPDIVDRGSTDTTSRRGCRGAWRQAPAASRVPVRGRGRGGGTTVAPAGDVGRCLRCTGVRHPCPEGKATVAATVSPHARALARGARI